MISATSSELVPMFTLAPIPYWTPSIIETVTVILQDNLS
jgi:hypothetical protein